MNDMLCSEGLEDILDDTGEPAGPRERQSRFACFKYITNPGSSYERRGLFNGAVRGYGFNNDCIILDIEALANDAFNFALDVTGEVINVKALDIYVGENHTPIAILPLLGDDRHYKIMRCLSTGMSMQSPDCLITIEISKQPI